MNHLTFFYFLFTTLTGIIAAGIFCISAARARQSYVRLFLLFFISFSIVIISEMLIVYLRLNVPTGNLPASGTLMLMSSVGVHLLLVFVPLLMHEIAGVRKQKILNVMFIAISSLVFILNRISSLIENLSLENPEDFLLIPVLLYSVIFGFARLGLIENQIGKIFYRKWLVLITGSLILLAIEMASGQSGGNTPAGQGFFIILKSGKALYPLLYAAFSIIFVHHFIRHLFSGTVPAENPDIDIVCSKYHLSPREKDVLLLILKGYSNSEIGKELFISLGTVKTHIGNIFGKIGVRQRAELLSLFISPKNPQAKTDQT